MNCKNGMMRIVFAGTPEFAVPTLSALAKSGHELVGVITRSDARLGRKRVLTPSPVAQAATELGIDTWKTNRLDEAATEWVAEKDPDLGVIVAYGGLVRAPLLETPRHGWINLHFSELPQWRGAAPVQRALMAGEQRLGVTVFRLVEALDAGAVLTRDAYEVPPGTAAGDALTTLAEFGTGTVTAAITALEQDPGAGEPQTGPATYAHKLSREDGRIDLSRPVSEVLAHWAGVTPEPGAFALHDGAPLKLHELRETTAVSGADPGAVKLVEGAAIISVGGDAGRALELVRVQPAGKPVMDGAAWLRGRGGSAELT